MENSLRTVVVVTGSAGSKYYRRRDDEKDNFKYVQAEPVDLSSSKIRKNIKMKKEWANLVPETVKEYIKKNNLYQ